MRSGRTDDWAQVRAQGKTRFLVKHGFLGRGLPLGALVAVAIEAALGSRFPEAFGSAPFLLRLVLLVGLFTATGCVRANFQWKLNEKRDSAGGA